MGPLIRVARAAFRAAARVDSAQLERVRDMLREAGEQLEKMGVGDANKVEEDDGVD